MKQEIDFTDYKTGFEAGKASAKMKTEIDYSLFLRDIGINPDVNLVRSNDFSRGFHDGKEQENKRLLQLGIEKSF